MKSSKSLTKSTLDTTTTIRNTAIKWGTLLRLPQKAPIQARSDAMKFTPYINFFSEAISSQLRSYLQGSKANGSAFLTSIRYD